MGWRRYKLYSIYRFVKITGAGIPFHTELEFSKSFATGSSPIKADFHLSKFSSGTCKRIWYKSFNKNRKTQKILKFFAFFGVCVFSTSSNFDLFGLLPSLEKKH